jgi:hypothetical protein
MPLLLVVLLSVPVLVAAYAVALLAGTLAA